MCGIVGTIGNSNIDISKSLSTILHRGPDDSGFFKDEYISLGFRRLSIIDLSPKGHQPMSNEDNTVWIIFNGEIYNYLELKKKLNSKHCFKSSTDTEVLIHGYEEWGMEKLLTKINGMFAFCIYDKKKNNAFLARDRIGKKPLYYYINKDYFAFSSETKAFFKLRDFRFSIDDEMFDLWMGFPYLPDNEKTIIKNVYKVPPGSYLQIRPGKKFVIKKYWELRHKTADIGFQEAQNKLEDLLVDSVTKRLVADVPLGILLSGGLDSSLITALAAKHSGRPVKTITIAFKNSIIDETRYAHAVAKYWKTDHTDLSLEIGDTYRELKSHIAIYDDLSTIDSGLFSTYLLSRKIRELGVKVVLVGEGSDEIFGGYSWFQLSQYPFRRLPDAWKSGLYYYAIARQLPDRRFFRYAGFLNRKLRETNGQSFFRQIQDYEISYSLPNHYCMKVDKGTMAASIEARAPYMDYRVVQLAASLPADYLLRSSIADPRKSNEKYILRRIAEKYLPDHIRNRKKLGGMMPVYDLLGKGLEADKELILKNDYLLEYYGRENLGRLIDSRPTIPAFKWQREWILWKSLLFTLWLNHFDKRHE